MDDSPPTQIGTSHFPTILAAQGITKPYNQTFNSLSTSMRSINLLTSCVPCNQSTYIPPGQLAALRSIKAVTHKQFSECGCRLVFLCRKGFCGSVPMACRSLLYLQYLTLNKQPLADLCSDLYQAFLLLRTYVFPCSLHTYCSLPCSGRMKIIQFSTNGAGKKIRGTLQLCNRSL